MEYEKSIDLLRRVVERWNELENRDCSRHEFSCLVSSIEDALDSPEPAPPESK